MRNLRETQLQIEELNRLGWYHSIELPDGQVIQGLQPVERLHRRIAQYPIPADLRGKRVLDIGAWDGWFSFEMEKRGAEVLAIDSATNTRFLTARELLGSKVDYRIADICRVTPRDIGRFDIVLFFGVLYHVKHPMLALERVCDLSTDMAFIESYVTDEGDGSEGPPVMEFYETTELAGQFDNWVGPNTACLLAMCRTAGFARVRFESAFDHRAHVSCFRHWDQHPGNGAAPRIVCVENSVSRDHEFSSTADDYVALWIEYAQSDLSVENVFPEIGGYGSRPVRVHRASETGWHVNCKLPPGLNAGWHRVRISADGSAWSESVRIAVDVPASERRPGVASPELELRIVCDGRDFERNVVHSGSISVWAAGIASTEAVSIRLNGTDLPATYVSEPDAEGVRQVNALLPAGIRSGEAWVTVVRPDAESMPSTIQLR